VFTHTRLGAAPEVVFMFPGGGAQYPDMARDLYETEPAFAEAMDRGLDHLEPQLDYDIRALWLPEGDPAEAAQILKKPSVQLPLIAIVEYALAKLWMSWGVKPAAMVGHSMGENVAACLAGVMTFEELIDLVLLRGRLFDTVAPGGMLSVPLSQAEIAAYLALPGATKARHYPTRFSTIQLKNMFQDYALPLAFATEQKQHIKNEIILWGEPPKKLN
jgi:acyl transferase domain-containing protein